MTSSMIRPLVVVVFAFVSTNIASGQDVCYYKQTRKVENGISSTNVSGGQFITFISDICYESNKKGIGVGHGNMMRNNDYSNSQYLIYQGSSYWGKDAVFKFNIDKSVLNVVLDNGDIYVYKRATAPSGQETCSLIREKPSSSNNNNGGFVGGFPPQPVYPNQPYTVPPQGGVDGGTSGNPVQPHQIMEDCPLCYGSGKCNTCNGTHRINYQFGSGTLECPNCRSDGRCSHCGGSGKVTKTKYY